MYPLHSFVTGCECPARLLPTGGPAGVADGNNAAVIHGRLRPMGRCVSNCDSFAGVMAVLAGRHHRDGSGCGTDSTPGRQ